MVSLPNVSRISNCNFVSPALPFPDQAGAGFAGMAALGTSPIGFRQKSLSECCRALPCLAGLQGPGDIAPQEIRTGPPWRGRLNKRLIGPPEIVGRQIFQVFYRQNIVASLGIHTTHSSMPWPGKPVIWALKPVYLALEGGARDTVNLKAVSQASQLDNLAHMTIIEPVEELRE